MSYIYIYIYIYIHKKNLIIYKIKTQKKMGGNQK